MNKNLVRNAQVTILLSVLNIVWWNKVKFYQKISYVETVVDH